MNYTVQEINELYTYTLKNLIISLHAFYFSPIHNKAKIRGEVWKWHNEHNKSRKLKGWRSLKMGEIQIGITVFYIPFN